MKNQETKNKKQKIENLGLNILEGKLTSNRIGWCGMDMC